MFVVVSCDLKSISKIFKGAIILALLLTLLSVTSAHKNDFCKSRKDVLRQKDIELVKMNEKYIEAKMDNPVYLDYHDAAYAQFPVVVVKEKLPHTLAY